MPVVFKGDSVLHSQHGRRAEQGHHYGQQYCDEYHQCAMRIDKLFEKQILGREYQQNHHQIEDLQVVDPDAAALEQEAVYFVQLDPAAPLEDEQQDKQYQHLNEQHNTIHYLSADIIRIQYGPFYGFHR